MQLSRMFLTRTKMFHNMESLKRLMMVNVMTWFHSIPDVFIFTLVTCPKQRCRETYKPGLIASSNAEVLPEEILARIESCVIGFLEQIFHNGSVPDVSLVSPHHVLGGSVILQHLVRC